MISFKDFHEPKPLYIYRPVLNAHDIRHWAQTQDFRTTLEPHDMHVTVAFSKTPVRWITLPQSGLNHVVVGPSERSVVPLGDKGAVVLKFESHLLQARWQQLIDAGCSWDFPSYQPHVSITYRGKELDTGKIIPYHGDIILGPEVLKDLNTDWDGDIKELPL